MDRVVFFDHARPDVVEKVQHWNGRVKVILPDQMIHMVPEKVADLPIGLGCQRFQLDPVQQFAGDSPKDGLLFFIRQIFNNFDQRARRLVPHFGVFGKHVCQEAVHDGFEGCPFFLRGQGFH